MFFPSPRQAFAAVALMALTACIIAQGVKVEELRATRADTVRVKTPVKAHLLDGSTVVYPSGVLVAGGVLRGSGTWFDLALKDPRPVQEIALDSLVGMESYRTSTNVGATIAYSLLVQTAAVGLAVGIACAADPKCFGSCPTFYSDSAGTAVLEAEGFSYSIAPLFEARDVDRLRARAGADGRLLLEVRNEAFETHYLNHLELLEARHRPDEFVLPDPRGQPVAAAALRPPARATDRNGHDATGLLATADGLTYRTDSTVLRSAQAADLEDFIDLTFPAPPGGDSLALVFRLRNSLLNTVLLYDIMLGDPGARSLDWQGDTLGRVGPAADLGRWYAGRMGLRVLIPGDSGYRQAGRIRDTGPVAWKDVAVVLPPQAGDSMRLRLAFVADNWRIDQVALGTMRRPEVRTIPLTEVLDRSGRPEPAADSSLARPDGRYLQTSPTQSFTAVWQTGPEPAGERRTFLLASQGYYIEWVRRGWIAAGRDTLPFVPGDAALVRALQRWRLTQDSLETRFYATRVPVR
jgi:hypothetical protein